MGKSRSHIANLMRLLALPDSIQDMLRAGQLSAGHARALLTADDPVGLAQKAVANGWSVRDVEQRAKSAAPSAPRAKGSARPSDKDADTLALEGDLSANLGMPVSIDHDTASGEGRVSIRYRDLEALDDLIQRLSKG
jgi:ParB family chromosome partitioning protein